MPFAGYFFSGPTAISALALTNIFVFFGVPILALLMAISRRLFHKSLTPRWQAGMWAFWLINFVSIFMLGITQVREFNQEASFNQVVDTPQFDSDTIYIKSIPDPSNEAIISLGDLKLGDDELKSDHIHLTLEKSTTNEFELVQKVESRGRRHDIAAQLAGAIEYNVVVDGNTLRFPSAFSIPKGKKWRGQQVHFVLKIPVGKTVKLDNRMSRKVWHFEKNNELEQPWVHGGKEFWTMENNGFVAHDYLKRNRDERIFLYTGFEDIQVEGMVELDIKQGDKYDIQILGKSKYTRKVEIIGVDKLLSITSDMDRRISPVKVEITMPRLNSLDIENTDDVRITGFTQDQMTLKTNGRNEVKAIVNIDHLIVKQENRSEVSISGKGKSLKATLSDRARLDSERFGVKVAELRMGDNSKAEVAVSDTIYTYANDHGHHHLSVDGEPVIIHDGEGVDLGSINIDH